MLISKKETNEKYIFYLLLTVLFIIINKKNTYNQL